ncbi:MAG TPA: O-antigen ligase family protein [Beijerinckiaceae bacterium]|nr:O-antigen ligase family protein [Beijerinckiaceae bacterium]
MSVAASGIALARPTSRGVPILRLAQAFAYALLGAFIFFICFTFLRPSPYDFIALPAMALWLALGIRLHRSSVPFVGLLFAYHVGLLIALLPYFDEPRPVEWTYQSVYLMVTAIFFAMFFSDRTASRIEFVLKAYLASCLFAAAAGIASYYDLFDRVLFKMDGRAAGVFEDPNVLGSFLIPGALYLMHNLIAGRSRVPLLAVASLAVLATGIFLSFSRGSWLALVVSTGTMVALMYRTSVSARLRARIVALTVAAAALAAVAVAGALSVTDIADRFEDRAQLTKDYDEGVTGRFGNQLRSIPMLIERPNGFGPLRFRLFFGLEPHNSYIGGFANGGWLGGFSFLFLVLATTYVGFRLCLAPSPFRREAQIVWPALFIFFLQALQIDVDHWRHVFLLFGMVWGLEAGRVRWLQTRA